MVPGLDVKPLLAELKARVAEELDYLAESEAQRAFAIAYEGDRDFRVPHVLSASPQVLVSEWLEGFPWRRSSARAPSRSGDHFGTLYLRFLLSGPARAGLLHADPHPGNFRALPDGKLGVLDFGAAARIARRVTRRDGSSAPARGGGRCQGVLDGLREEGFVKEGIELEPGDMLDYLEPLVEPARHEVFNTPDVAARPVPATEQPAQQGLRHRDEVQPAAGLPAHPSGVAGLHRRPVPTRRQCAHPRRDHRLGARFARPGDLD